MFGGEEHKGTPRTNFHGMYMAEVIDDVDPEYAALGRVKVRVFPMMLQLDEAVLPWAMPAMPLFEGGAADVGSYVVPMKNSKVWVFFVAGDVRSPVYFANAIGVGDGPVGSEPGLLQWTTRSGVKLKIDARSGSEQVSLETEAGHKVDIVDGGDITIEHEDGETIVLKDGAIEIGSGTLNHLINEAFKSLFDNHGHSYTPSGSGIPAKTSGPCRDPAGIVPDPITAAMITVETEAS